jgi:peptidoglycan/LPS O-acetylase OafA/YrhL
MVTTRRASSRIPSLDGLRAVAITLVCMGHIAAVLGARKNRTIEITHATTRYSACATTG